jgi:hypothetical protein
MKDLFEYAGWIFWLAGLSLMGYAGWSAWKLHKANRLSFAVLEQAFWFRTPGDFLSGLTPNARWLLFALGGFVVFLIGRHMRNVASPYLRHSRDSHDPGDGDYS